MRRLILPSFGYFEIKYFNYSAELWVQRVMLYYVEQKEGAWLHPENIQQTMIETVPGQPFEVNFQDLNVDGMICI